MTLGLERTLVRLAIPSLPLFWMLDSYILLTQFSIWDKPFEMGVGWSMVEGHRIKKTISPDYI